MPRTRECDYCESDIEPGTGTMFVRTDGTTIHYCSSKCEKNADLGREARDLEWTGEEEVQAESEPEVEEAETEEPEAEDDEEVESEAAEDAEAADSEEPEDADEDADEEDAEEAEA